MFEQEMYNIIHQEVSKNHKPASKIRNASEYIDQKDQPRNTKCDCGSGLKYKKCCGRPKKMDLTTYYRGRILDFVFYEGEDKKEYDSLLNFVHSLKETDMPLCLPGVKFDIKLINIETEELNNAMDDSLFYCIKIKGVIL